MENNPFLDASYYTSKMLLSNKLEDMATEWEIMTDDGKNADDATLLILLSDNNMDDVYYDYMLEKNGDAFDPKALHDAIENWIFIKG